MENCDICANDVFRASWGDTGVTRAAFPAPHAAPPAAPAPAPAAVDYDAIVKAVTEQVCRELGITAA
jgi:L-fuculose-phosphate aldolase